MVSQLKSKNIVTPKYLENHDLFLWVQVFSDYKNTCAGWGRKKSFFKAQTYAKKNGTKVLCLEDGFVRSLGLGKEGYSPLSLVVDQTGIYFDAFQTSDLEKLILQDEDIKFNIRA